MVNQLELKKKFKQKAVKSNQKNRIFLSLLILFSFNLSAFEMPEINLPNGFQIDVLTDDVPNARSLALGEEMIFVSTREEGSIYAVTNYQDDPQVVVIAEGLYMPNGIAFHQGNLYVAEIHRVLKFTDIEDTINKISIEKSSVDSIKYSVISDYPKDRHHGWRYIIVGPDNKLYVPIGAPCNVCEEPGYAVITRMNLDGTEKETVAYGIRNTVGMTFHPETNELWFTDNGRDMLGDNLPPGELNKLSRVGEHFGFPFCHATSIKDPQYGSQGDCGEATAPAQELGPHVAPLGLKFYKGTMFPENYHDQIFIAEHGSWNRSEKIGYRITTVAVDGDKGVSYEVFADGWMKNEETLGRPADILILDDGSMLVSDDKNGVIYKITYEE